MFTEYTAICKELKRANFTNRNNGTTPPPPQKKNNKKQKNPQKLKKIKEDIKIFAFCSEAKRLINFLSQTLCTLVLNLHHYTLHAFHQHTHSAQHTKSNHYLLNPNLHDADAWSTSQHYTSVPWVLICLNRCTYCHTVIDVADQTCYLTHRQYTGTRPTSPCVDPITQRA